MSADILLKVLNAFTYIIASTGNNICSIISSNF
jgi:hypothetical protein